MRHDIAIVLGGGRESPTRLTKRTLLRIDKAKELYDGGDVPRLLMSGGTSYLEGAAEGQSEASLMRRYATQLGITVEAVLVEEQSRETLGNAYFSRIEVLEPNGWNDVVVVTSDFHVARAQYVFGKVLAGRFNCTFVSAASGASPDVVARWSELEARATKQYHALLDPIGAGDLTAVGELVARAHAAWAQNPAITVEELVRLLRGGA